MITMIIADDEPFIRSSLKKAFNWEEEFGITIIGEAEDGQEAYELCLAHQPEILFTDIMMPLWDGLQVAEKLKEARCPTKIIIISGVQDFSYAQNALMVNAEGYILKPVKLHEVQDVFRKVVGSIQEDRAAQVNLDHLKKQLQENTPLIRDKFLQNMIAGLYPDSPEIWEKLRFFEIPLCPGNHFTVAVLQLDDYQTALEKYSEEYKQLLYFSIQNIINEILEARHAGLSFVAHENEFILLFYSPDNVNSEETSRICEELIQNIGRFLKLSVSIGIGSACLQIHKVAESYKEALTALIYKFYTGQHSIIHINDIQPGTETLQSTYFYKFHAGLMNALKVGNTDKVVSLLEELFQLLSEPKLQIDYVQNICSEIIFTSARTLYELDENIEYVLKDRMTIMNDLYNKMNIQQLKDYMLQLFTDLTRYLENKNTTKNSKTINKIKEIIHEGYSQELSISKIAEQVFLTPNYISLIFKQGTKETITDYITKVRIEHAKKLLHNTDLKVREIAEQVGYENPHYFSTVFKKTAGSHPLKYRTDITHQSH
ncbi:response regulator [Paenibacillus wynnii]|uniref:response regulator n=1 Tax=Paenibacillus wynnii TaxID=268407 RepID=UPI002790AA42|nr:response regulator [Paenibacillus wynnii]MDQ0194219.1 two-component system response regulator YesN [Paenibacillus wynnii]